MLDTGLRGSAGVIWFQRKEDLGKGFFAFDKIVHSKR